MNLIQKKEPDFTNIVAGNSATAKVNTQKNIHMLLLRFLNSSGVALTVAEMKAAGGDLLVKIDSEVVWQVDVTFLLERQKYYGDIALGGNVSGVVPIVFTRPLLDNLAERAASALGMGNVDSLTVEVSISSTAVLSKIELYSVSDDLPLRNLGQHIRIHKNGRAWSTASAQELIDLPIKDPNAIAYLAEHYRYTSGTLAYVKVNRNDNVIFEKLYADTNNVLLNLAKRTPQSNYFHIDYDALNNVASVVPMPSTSFYHELGWTSAPTTFTVYTERLFKDPKAA